MNVSVHVDNLSTLSLSTTPNTESTECRDAKTARGDEIYFPISEVGQIRAPHYPWYPEGYLVFPSSSLFCFSVFHHSCP